MILSFLEYFFIFHTKKTLWLNYMYVEQIISFIFLILNQFQVGITFGLIFRLKIVQLIKNFNNLLYLGYNNTYKQLK